MHGHFPGASNHLTYCILLLAKPSELRVPSLGLCLCCLAAHDAAVLLRHGRGEGAVAPSHVRRGLVEGRALRDPALQTPAEALHPPGWVSARGLGCTEEVPTRLQRGVPLPAPHCQGGLLSWARGLYAFSRRGGRRQWVRTAHGPGFSSQHIHQARASAGAPGACHVPFYDEDVSECSCGGGCRRCWGRDELRGVSPCVTPVAPRTLNGTLLASQLMSAKLQIIKESSSPDFGREACLTCIVLFHSF